MILYDLSLQMADCSVKETNRLIPGIYIINGLKIYIIIINRNLDS